MRVPYNYLPDQFADIEPYISDIRELVQSTQFTLGPYVERFEKKFAEYIGAKHVISTNTGTDALILSLKALDIGPGDEVITVANTFYATVGAIVAVGARPVFVDCDSRYQIDVDQVASTITKKTKAILPVHWAGSPPDITGILSVASKVGCHVVEDACPAVGAKVGDKFAGTFGKVNAFSMHPLKPLNVWGDGGMIATDDDEIARFLTLYRNHGMVDRDTIEMWGINSRLQPLQAIVGMRQLDAIEESIRVRNINAQLLDDGLKKLEGLVSVPERPSHMREVFQLYLGCFQRRDELLSYLVKHEIEAKVHYPVPVHLQKPGRALGYMEGAFPVAEKQAQEILTLPSHQFITPDQIAYMLSTITDFYGRG